MKLVNGRPKKKKHALVVDLGMAGNGNGALPPPGPSDASLYLNRELALLDFSRRVLEEAPVELRTRTMDLDEELPPGGADVERLDLGGRRIAPHFHEARPGRVLREDGRLSGTAPKDPGPLEVDRRDHEERGQVRRPVRRRRGRDAA